MAPLSAKPAEARLATALAAGGSLAAIAAQFQVTLAKYARTNPITPISSLFGSLDHLH
jgi:hypothetical protein